MKKRIFTTLLAACLAAALVPAVALAQDAGGALPEQDAELQAQDVEYEARIGDDYYETLAAALEAAEASESPLPAVVMLLKNIPASTEDIVVPDYVVLDLNHFVLNTTGAIENNGIIIFHQENAEFASYLLFHVPGAYGTHEEVKLPSDDEANIVFPESAFISTGIDEDDGCWTLDMAIGDDPLVWNIDVPANTHLDVLRALTLGGDIKAGKASTLYFALSDDIVIGGNGDGGSEAVLSVLSLPEDEVSEREKGAFSANGKKITLNKSGKVVLSTDIVFDESVLVSGVEGMKVGKQQNAEEGTVTYLLVKDESGEPTVDPALPQAGDNGIAYLWLVLAVMSGCVLVAAAACSRRNRGENR